MFPVAKKIKKKPARNRFLDDEADHDDDMDDDEGACFFNIKMMILPVKIMIFVTDDLDGEDAGLIDNDTSPTGRTEREELRAAEREMEAKSKEGKGAKSGVKKYSDRLKDIEERYQNVDEEELDDDIMVRF